MPHQVLVVDDDPGIRQLIEMVLQDEGFDVVTAANGKEALERINESRPALVLLDLQMPVMTGWEVLSQVREANIEVPVVFMTAGYRAKTEAERYNADGYVAKPFDLTEIIDTVERFTTSAPR
jgi:CheY-like chemotaxis protein